MKIQIYTSVTLFSRTHLSPPLPSPIHMQSSQHTQPVRITDLLSIISATKKQMQRLHPWTRRPNNHIPFTVIRHLNLHPRIYLAWAITILTHLLVQETNTPQTTRDI